MKKTNRPRQIDNLLEKIRECIEDGNFTQTAHALERQEERNLGLPKILYVLKTGKHEKEKTTYDDHFNKWKYAIRGNTLDGVDVRVIIAFDERGFLIITIIRVGKI